MHKEDKVYALCDIDIKSFIATDKLQQQWIANGHSNYHHSLLDQEANHFNIQFPLMLTSSIARVPDGGHYINAGVYGNYAKAYASVAAGIDTMLLDHPLSPPTTLKGLFFRQMVQQANYPLALIEAEYTTLVTKQARVFDVVLFRQLATGFMITSELIRQDREGTEVLKALHRLRQCYSDSLSQEQRQVENKNTLSQWGEGAVAEIAQWHRYPRGHPLSALIDYRKSPFIQFHFIETKYKRNHNYSRDLTIMLPSDNDHLVHVSVFDYVTNPHDATLTSNAQAFDHFLSKEGAPPFKLLQSIRVIAPAVYFADTKKKGVFIFKVKQLKVHDKIPVPEEPKEESLPNVAAAVVVDPLRINSVLESLDKIVSSRQPIYSIIPIALIAFFIYTLFLGYMRSGSL